VADRFVLIAPTLQAGVDAILVGMDERARGNRGLDDQLDRGGWLKARASLLSRKGARHSQKSRYSTAELTTTPAKLVPAIHSMAKGSW